MPEIMADPPAISCYPPASGGRSEQYQPLGPDPFRARARDARGRFAQGHSGNPRGRPRGIPNPQRRVPDLIARPLTPQALSALIARKPHLLRPLAAQFLPPPLPPQDPAERLGIDLSSVRTAEHMWQILSTVFAAASRGDIAPAEALSIVRRARTRLRAALRLERRRRWQARALAAGGSQPARILPRPSRPVGARVYPPGAL